MKEKVLFNIGRGMMVCGVTGSIGFMFLGLSNIATYSLALVLIGFGCAIFNVSITEE